MWKDPFSLERRDVEGSIEIVKSSDGHPTGRVCVGLDLEKECDEALNEISRLEEEIVFKEAALPTRVRPVVDVALVRGSKVGARSDPREHRKNLLRPLHHGRMMLIQRTLKLWNRMVSQSMFLKKHFWLLVVTQPLPLRIKQERENACERSMTLVVTSKNSFRCTLTLEGVGFYEGEARSQVRINVFVRWRVGIQPI